MRQSRSLMRVVEGNPRGRVEAEHLVEGWWMWLGLEALEHSQRNVPGRT